MAETKKTRAETASDATDEKQISQICGVIMPISTIDGCSEAHWSDVLSIVSEAIEAAGFEANLVSNADDVAIIQKRIIQNLYENPVVVCDVSGKNPNVMFELGMRLAFDRPTIIIKDDKTSYSFDTSPIEHLEYPRDLRFSKIVEFKQKLSSKIAATYKSSNDDKSYTTFLKHFGEFTVAKLDKKEISGEEYIIEELKNMRLSLRFLESNYRRQSYARPARLNRDFELCLGAYDESIINYIENLVLDHPAVTSTYIENVEGHKHILATVTPSATDRAVDIRGELQTMIRQRFSRKRKAAATA